MNSPVTKELVEKLLNSKIDDLGFNAKVKKLLPQSCKKLSDLITTPLSVIKGTYRLGVTSVFNIEKVINDLNYEYFQSQTILKPGMRKAEVEDMLSGKAFGLNFEENFNTYPAANKSNIVVALTSGFTSEVSKKDIYFLQITHKDAAGKISELEGVLAGTKYTRALERHNEIVTEFNKFAQENNGHITKEDAESFLQKYKSIKATNAFINSITPIKNPENKSNIMACKRSEAGKNGRKYIELIHKDANGELLHLGEVFAGVNNQEAKITLSKIIVGLNRVAGKYKGGYIPVEKAKNFIEFIENNNLQVATSMAR
jgi:hypothetical protein